MIVAVVALLGTGVWALFFNAYFAVDTVVINGAHYVDEGRLYGIVNDQLDTRRWLFFPQDNIFMFSKNELASLIQNEVSVRNLTIDKDLPRSLTISFKEVEPAAIWSNGEQYYYVNAELDVLSPVSPVLARQSDYITLESGVGEEHVVWTETGRAINVSPDYLAAAELLYREYGSGNEVDEGMAEEGSGSEEALPRVHIQAQPVFIVTTQETTLTMLSLEGLEVYFNIDEDIAAQMQKLDAVLAEKFNGADLVNTTYIDLRFGDKVYFR